MSETKASVEARATAAERETRMETSKVNGAVDDETILSQDAGQLQPEIARLAAIRGRRDEGGRCG
jgi:hypothetical protein